MDKRTIKLVVMKLETDGHGLYARSGIGTFIFDVFGDEGKEFEDYFASLYRKYKVEEMLDKLAYRFAEMCGDKIDVTIDTVELEKQIREAREHEV